ncbi:YHS domain-containing protein [Actinopolymorpha alba]|uniref:YHS domain-containing protein n=1 Tax=Actinopolymorpha alba TaxID=533267 RepID=UPI0003739D55|nr:YHS domain-containing protein [Actinopolymorpha alba]
MIFVELFVPKGTLAPEQRRAIGPRIVAELMSDQGAPEVVIESGRNLTQVIVHEPDTWTVGSQTVEPSDPPRYLVRVSVPQTWRKGMGPYAISRITKVLAGLDQDPRRVYDEPIAWVQVIGIPEGGLGIFGQVMGTNDITRLITKPYREAPEGSIPVVEPEPGTAIDPTCGMTVPLTEKAITLEYAGTTYAFCCAECRTIFAEDHTPMLR